MRFVSIGFEDGTLGILGLTPADIDALVLKRATQPLDLTRNFKIGLALPTILQIMFDDTDELIEARIELAVRSAGGWNDGEGPVDVPE